MSFFDKGLHMREMMCSQCQMTTTHTRSNLVALWTCRGESHTHPTSDDTVQFFVLLRLPIPEFLKGSDGEPIRFGSLQAAHDGACSNIVGASGGYVVLVWKGDGKIAAFEYK